MKGVIHCKLNEEQEIEEMVGPCYPAASSFVDDETTIGGGGGGGGGGTTTTTLSILY